MIKRRNKKGAGTFEGWTEGVVFSIMFVIILGVVVMGGMNSIHTENVSIQGFETGDIEQNFENYQISQSDKLQKAEATFIGAVGLTLSTSWDIITGILTMVMSFITGGWVASIVSSIGLPSQVAWLLRGLWIVSLGFIVLSILFNKNKI